MRKICLVLALVLILSVNVAQAQVPIFQTYSFVPGVNVSAISQEQKDFFQKKVNDLGSPPPGTIVIYALNAKYLANGSLWVLAFVRNGFNHPMHEMKSTITVKSLDGQIISSGYYYFEPSKFGVLSPGDSRVWELTFPSQSVFNRPASLSKGCTIINKFTWD